VRLKLVARHHTDRLPAQLDIEPGPDALLVGDQFSRVLSTWASCSAGVSRRRRVDTRHGPCPSTGQRTCRIRPGWTPRWERKRSRSNRGWRRFNPRRSTRVDASHDHSRLTNAAAKQESSVTLLPDAPAPSHRRWPADWFSAVSTGASLAASIFLRMGYACPDLRRNGCIFNDKTPESAIVPV